MAICICDISALELLRSRGKLAPELLGCARTSSLKECVIPTQLELEDVMSRLGGVRRPCHLMVESDRSRKCQWTVRHERSKELPLKSLIRLSGDLLVESPELLFCDLAASDEFDVIDLAMLGFELCGTYLLDEDKNSWKGFVNIDMSMTSTSKIARILEYRVGMAGSKKAQEALGLVIDGCHSPMESVLAALLTFPRCLGGFGLKGAQMNFRVQTLSGERFVDIGFPELKIAYEYKGRKYHLPEQAGRDDRRQNALVGAGWTVINVWHEDLTDPYLFAELESNTYKAVGRRQRNRSERFRMRQQVLRSRLVPGLQRFEPMN